MQSPVFRSRIDPLLVGLVFIPLLGACGLVLQRVISSGEAIGLITLSIIALSVALLAWIFASTSYHFTDSQLIVQAGPFRSRVPVESIRRVIRTRTLQSAPALSLQRLKITYGEHDVIIISPHDEIAFLAALRARAPTAQLPTGD